MCFNPVLYFTVINCLIQLADRTYCITKTIIKHLLQFFKCALNHKQNAFLRQYGQLQISDIYKQIILFVDKIVRSLAVMQTLQSDLVDSLVNLRSYPHLWPEMSFLRRVSGFRDWTRSSFIQEELGVELILDTTPILHGKQPVEVFWACPSGRRPLGRFQTHWMNYISQLVWDHLVGLPTSWRRWLDTRWCGYL